jgi:hypothetical protein
MNPKAVKTRCTIPVMWRNGKPNIAEWLAFLETPLGQAL